MNWFKTIGLCVMEGAAIALGGIIMTKAVNSISDPVSKAKRKSCMNKVKTLFTKKNFKVKES